MPEANTVSLALIDFKQRKPKCTNLEQNGATELEYNLILISKEKKSSEAFRKENLNLHISLYIQYGMQKKDLTCYVEEGERFSNSVKSYTKVHTFSQENRKFVFIELDETSDFQINSITVYKDFKTLNVFNILLNCDSPFYSTRTREFFEPITHQIAKGKLDSKLNVHYLNIRRPLGDSIQEEVFHKNGEYSFYFSKSQGEKSLSYLLHLLSHQEEVVTEADSVDSLMDNNKVSMNHSVKESWEGNKIILSKDNKESKKYKEESFIKAPLGQIDLNKPNEGMKRDSLPSMCPREKGNEFRTDDTSKNNFVLNNENLQPNRTNCGEIKTLVPPKLNHKYNSIGLPRLTNSCYINAVLQCLLNAVNLVYDFGEKSNFKYKQGNSAIQSFFGILDEVQNYDRSKAEHHKNRLQNKIINLKRKVGEHNSTFNDNEQKDAYEFLMNVLECLSSELKCTGAEPAPVNKSNSKKQQVSDRMIKSNEHYQNMLAEENNIITLLFRGQLENLMVCSKCKKSQSCFEPLWALCLGFRKRKNLHSMTLEDLLNDFTAQETFDCDCNGECQIETNHNSYYLLCRSPNILLITFKKFRLTSEGYQKIDYNLEYPVENLKMSHESENGSTKEENYMLFGVIHHSGTLESGHYTADCLNLSENKWYYFNDDYVGASKIQANMERACGDPSVLFYIKKSCINKFKMDSKTNGCNMF